MERKWGFQRVTFDLRPHEFDGGDDANHFERTRFESWRHRCRGRATLQVTDGALNNL